MSGVDMILGGGVLTHPRLTKDVKWGRVKFPWGSLKVLLAKMA